MANRTRPNQILFFVSDDEKRIIKAKMAQLGTKNMGAYLRKMAIDGYIIKVDYTQQQPHPRNCKQPSRLYARPAED